MEIYHRVKPITDTAKYECSRYSRRANLGIELAKYSEQITTLSIWKDKEGLKKCKGSSLGSHLGDAKHLAVGEMRLASGHALMVAW